MFSTKAACKVYQHKLNKSLFIAIPIINQNGIFKYTKAIESEGIHPDIQFDSKF